MPEIRQNPSADCFASWLAGVKIMPDTNFLARFYLLQALMKEDGEFLQRGPISTLLSDQQVQGALDLMDGMHKRNGVPVHTIGYATRIEGRSRIVGPDKIQTLWAAGEIGINNSLQGIRRYYLPQKLVEVRTDLENVLCYCVELVDSKTGKGAIKVYKTMLADGSTREISRSILSQIGEWIRFEVGKNLKLKTLSRKTLDNFIIALGRP